MKDAYSFDLTIEDAKKTYGTIYEAYLRTFSRMRLKAIPVKADTGPIGGDLSHEFQIVAPTGESTIYYDKRFDELDEASRTLDNTRHLYSAADEMHDPATCSVSAEDLRTARGIEVGHIFFFGTKYSESMNATVMDEDGKLIHPQMGSYGIGVSRLVGAIIEASHDDNGIIWPEAVAPYHVGLISLKTDDLAVTKVCEELYAKIYAAGRDALYDDRDSRPGAKFADMDLIGLPWQIIVGPRGLESGTVEVKNRATSERHIVSKEDALKIVLA